MTKKKPTDEKIDATAQRTREQDRHALRRKVSIFYDIQRLRMQTAGRTYERADGTEIQLHEVDIAILEQRAKELEAAEKHALRDVEAHLNTMPFFVNVLSDKVRYRGIGPTMAGVILSSFDIEREDTVSKMWSFAGLRPLPAVRCRECQSVVEVEFGGMTPSAGGGQMLAPLTTFRHIKERTRTPSPPKPGEAAEPKLPKCSKASIELTLRDVFESGKAQRPVKNEKLTYNSWLRTKLVGVLADVMIKVGSPWKKYYDEYKHRKATAGWGCSDGHRDRAAKRYMIKMLLLDIWKEWRAHEGLPVRPSYHEEKQGGHGFGGRNGQLSPVAEEISPEVAAELEQVS